MRIYPLLFINKGQRDRTYPPRIVSVSAYTPVIIVTRLSHWYYD